MAIFEYATYLSTDVACPKLRTTVFVYRRLHSALDPRYVDWGLWGHSIIPPDDPGSVLVSYCMGWNCDISFFSIQKNLIANIWCTHIIKWYIHQCIYNWAKMHLHKRFTAKKKSLKQVMNNLFDRYPQNSTSSKIRKRRHAFEINYECL